MATQPNPQLEAEIHHLSKKPVDALTLATPTPLDLLRVAVSQNANIDQLAKLMDLHERWEKREAKRAYDAAMNAFKAESPRITKNHRVNFEAKDRSKGTTDYRHATLDHVCDAIIGTLSKHGISHRWKVTQEAEWITVTCILTHALGHAEETSLRGCPDNTGNKNSIQAVGSTVTYLQRYTLLAATGLATTDQDDDGRGALVIDAAMPQERIEQLCAAIANAPNVAELQQRYFEAGREAKKIKDWRSGREVLAAFIQAKDARKAELR
ncbi:MAG TPA: ERF family protein [Candidatus Nitrosotalea sp.]|nr:ERF family protein [Candidatus Nitrosotalea sp.]